MNVHSLLSSRLLTVPAVLIAGLLVVGGVVTTVEPLTADRSVAAGITLSFVALVVVGAVLGGVFGGSRRSTNYW